MKKINLSSLCVFFFSLFLICCFQTTDSFAFFSQKQEGGDNSSVSSEDIVGKSFLLFYGESPKTPRSRLVKWQEGFVFYDLEDVPREAYFFKKTTEGEVLVLRNKKGPISLYLSKKRGTDVFELKSEKGTLLCHLKPVPKGFEYLVKAKNLYYGGSGSKNKPNPEALPEALYFLEKGLEVGAEITRFQIGVLLFTLQQYEDAKAAFASTGDFGQSAVCEIMHSVENRNPIPDIEKVAKRAWESLFDGQEYLGFKERFTLLEAVAYSCGVSGRYDLAKEYISRIIFQVNNEILTGNENPELSKIDINRLKKMEYLYSMNQSSSTFTASWKKGR